MIHIYFEDNLLPPWAHCVSPKRDTPPDNIVTYGAHVRYSPEYSTDTGGMAEYLWQKGHLAINVHPSSFPVLFTELIAKVQRRANSLREVNCLDIKIGKENLPLGHHHKSAYEDMSIRSAGPDQVIVTTSALGPEALKQFLRTWEELTRGEFELPT